MDYKNYSVEEFLKDDFFVKWVNKNDPYVNQFWENWLKSNPHKVDQVMEAKEIICSLTYLRKNKLDDSEFAMLYEKILKGKEPKNSFFRMENLFTKWGKIAAVIVFIIVSVTAIFNVTMNENKVRAVASYYKHAKSGEKLTFQLPDGSKVKLNSESTIRYTGAFGSERREVFLEGEAFFEVVKDSIHPFVVKTEHIAVKALGTSFNINTYDDEETTGATLLSGKIRVSVGKGISSTKWEYLLEPGEELIYNKEGGSVVHRSFDYHDALSWKDGIISFQDAEFEDVIRNLERWYGVVFNVKNGHQMKASRFSGTFDNESLKNVLEVLSFAGKFSFEMKGKTVLIDFKVNKL